MKLKQIKTTIQKIKKDVLPAIKGCKELTDLEDFRLQYLGKKGVITSILKAMKELPAEDKPQVGQSINSAKDDVRVAITKRWKELSDAKLRKRIKSERIDVTLPGITVPPGALHPITQVLERITTIFHGLGYAVEEGPEIETDYYNFEALNIPQNHPARDMQDTFYVDDGYLLRTHTSPMQIRTLLQRKPPIQIIVPGAVYRRDSDPTHSPMFHQVEGLAIGKNITMADLRGTLWRFIKEMFGANTKFRMRPSYFPFTEPSAEVDMAFTRAGSHKGDDKKTEWLEILGCGMVDPAVLREVGIDPEEYQGFAFGVGVERVAMLLDEITDIRLFYEGHNKFLEQFV